MPNTFGDMAVQNLWHMPYQTFMLKKKQKYNRFNQKTKKINNFLFLVDISLFVLREIYAFFTFRGTLLQFLKMGCESHT